MIDRAYEIDLSWVLYCRRTRVSRAATDSITSRELAESEIASLKALETRRACNYGVNSVTTRMDLGEEEET